MYLLEPMVPVNANILEAVGMVAAERAPCQIEVNAMVQKGIRIAKPDLMVSSFDGQMANSTISVNVSGTESARIKYTVYNPTPEDIYSTWAARLLNRGKS